MNVVLYFENIKDAAFNPNRKSSQKFQSPARPNENVYHVHVKEIVRSGFYYKKVVLHETLHRKTDAFNRRLIFADKLLGKKAKIKKLVDGKQ